MSPGAGVSSTWGVTGTFLTILWWPVSHSTKLSSILHQTAHLGRPPSLWWFSKLLTPGEVCLHWDAHAIRKQEVERFARSNGNPLAPLMPGT